MSNKCFIFCLFYVFLFLFFSSFASVPTGLSSPHAGSKWKLNDLSSPQGKIPLEIAAERRETGMSLSDLAEASNRCHYGCSSGCLPSTSVRSVKGRVFNDVERKRAPRVQWTGLLREFPQVSSRSGPSMTPLKSSLPIKPPLHLTDF